MHVYNVASGTTRNVGLAVGGRSEGFADSFWPFTLEAGRVVFSVPEAAQRKDLNGDGDTRDSVPHLYDTASGQAVNIGLAASGWQLRGGRVALRVPERGQGSGDLNGDGDRRDNVLHLYDAASGRTLSLGLAVPYAQLEAGQLAFLVREKSQGRSDLNDDGDARDYVLHVKELGTGDIINLGLASGDHGPLTNFDAERNRIAFLVGERAQGGHDLNGDGDVTDKVLHVYTLGVEPPSNRGRRLTDRPFPAAG